jgi:tape measure domain-containing protein
MTDEKRIRIVITSEQAKKNVDELTKSLESGSSALEKAKSDVDNLGKAYRDASYAAKDAAKGQKQDLINNARDTKEKLITAQKELRTAEKENSEQIKSIKAAQAQYEKALIRETAEAKKAQQALGFSMYKDEQAKYKSILDEAYSQNKAINDKKVADEKAQQALGLSMFKDAEAQHKAMLDEAYAHHKMLLDKKSQAEKEHKALGLAMFRDEQAKYKAMLDEAYAHNKSLDDKALQAKKDQLALGLAMYKDVQRQEMAMLNESYAQNKAISDKKKKDIQEIAETQRSATFTLTALGAAIGAVISAQRIIEYSDAWNNLNNQLMQTASEAGHLGVITSQLLDTSNRTRQSLESTADLYTRVSLATTNLGYSEQQVIGITETVSNMLLVGGKSAQSTRHALMQLGQAFNKGYLDGEEFRSVAENMPMILKAIEQQTGKTRGELMNLSAQHGISAQLMAKSFLAYQDTAAQMAARTKMTFEQAATIAKNNAAAYIGNNAAIQSSVSTLAGVVASGSEHMGVALTVFAGVTVAAGAAMLPVIYEMTLAFLRLRAAGGPWIIAAGAIASLATGLALNLGKASDEMERLKGSTEDAAEAFKKLNAAQKEQHLKALSDTIDKDSKELDKLGKKLDRLTDQYLAGKKVNDKGRVGNTTLIPFADEEEKKKASANLANIEDDYLKLAKTVEDNKKKFDVLSDPSKASAVANRPSISPPDVTEESKKITEKLEAQTLAEETAYEQRYNAAKKHAENMVAIRKQMARDFNDASSGNQEDKNSSAVDNANAQTEELKASLDSRLKMTAYYQGAEEVSYEGSYEREVARLDAKLNIQEEQENNAYTKKIIRLEAEKEAAKKKADDEVVSLEQHKQTMLERFEGDAEEQAAITDGYDKKILEAKKIQRQAEADIDDAYRETEKAVLEEHEANKNDIFARGNKDRKKLDLMEKERKIGMYADLASTGVTLLKSFGSQSFQAQKNFAIADSIISTSQGVAKALAMGPAGYVPAGIIAAKGLAEVNNIRKTTPNGGSGGSSYSASGTTTASSEPAFQQKTIIDFRGIGADSLLTGSQVIETLTAALTGNSNFVVALNGAQQEAQRKGFV